MCGGGAGWLRPVAATTTITRLPQVGRSVVALSNLRSRPAPWVQVVLFFKNSRGIRVDPWVGRSIIFKKFSTMRYYF